MAYTVVGKSVSKVDAIAKVTGKAKYTDDFSERDMLVGKILHSPYAHAIITTIDVSLARALPGVEAVLTYKDLPRINYATSLPGVIEDIIEDVIEAELEAELEAERIKFGTAGHPYSLDPSHRDVEDRHILTKKARFVGDAIAAVVATDELIAEKALKLIEVEYKVLEALTSTDAALREGAPLIHEGRERNILASGGFVIGDVEEAFKESDHVFEGEYETSIVQHCHLENQTSYAYKDTDGRIVIVTSTQIPQIVRRVVAQALGIPWGSVRVIKPFVGGGFGNKQDVCIEPLNAAMTLAVGGRSVKIELSREECMIDTRTRHAFKFKIKTGINQDGKIIGIHISAISNTGAYASHGHSIAGSAGGKFRYLYPTKALKYDPITVYTNLPVAGAMRGYGTPQIFYAFEAHLEDIAKRLNMDPIEIRRKNLVEVGYVDPVSKNKITSCGIRECIDKGKALIKWDKKKALYKEQSGEKLRGLGMACFSYASGTYPVALELAGARIVLNQDGSVQLQIGATDTGQGSDEDAKNGSVSTQQKGIQPLLDVFGKASTLLAALSPILSQEVKDAKTPQGVNGTLDAEGGIIDPAAKGSSELRVQQKSDVMGLQENKTPKIIQGAFREEVQKGDSMQSTEVSGVKDIKNQNSSAGLGVASNLVAANVADGKTSAIPVWEQISTVVREQVLNKHSAVKELDIQLHPADLGKIQIGMRWENGQVHLVVRASEVATGQLLQNQLSDLRQNLTNQGVNCGMLQMGQGGERQQNPRGDESHRTFNQDTNPNEGEDQNSVSNSLSLGQDGINRINVMA